jgi:long-subunit fatty acid transport protein
MARRPTAPAAPRPTAAHGRIPAVVVDLLALLAAFVLASALAGLLGAANLGTALTFGTIAFAATLVALMLLRER